MDNLVKRALVTIAFVIGMMLFVYFMIATGPDKPAQLTLVYYNFMNRVFAAIWWFIKMLAVVAAIGGVGLVIFKLWTAKQDEEAEKELTLKKELIRQEEVRIRLEEKQTQKEEMKMKTRIEEIQQQEERAAREQYLKNRSAKEANKDAIKHFL